jgi:hypothetical protein
MKKDGKRKKKNRAKRPRQKPISSEPFLQKGNIDKEQEGTKKNVKGGRNKNRPDQLKEGKRQHNNAEAFPALFHKWGELSFFEHKRGSSQPE